MIVVGCADAGRWFFASALSSRWRIYRRDAGEMLADLKDHVVESEYAEVNSGPRGLPDGPAALGG